jgi:hypothetical protein
MIDKKKLEQLKILVDDYDSRKKIMDDRKTVFESENSLLISQIKTLSTQIDELKESIKPEAIAEFKEINKKKLTGGIGIRETDETTYDEVKALAWAKSKDLFICLDKKAFEKSAPSLGLDFVKIEKKTSVTFPSVIDI